MTCEPKAHLDLMGTVKEFLEDSNFEVATAAYHDVMPESAIAHLRECFDPTSLYVRGRSDSIAIYRGEDMVSFNWEAKTHSSSNRHDMCIEAMPLAHHQIISRYGVRCLYVYKDDAIGIEGGFWAHKIPPISRIYLPRRWKGELLKWFEKCLSRAYPDIEVFGCSWNPPASGDPFVVIDECNLDQLVDWRDEITNLIGNTDV